MVSVDTLRLLARRTKINSEARKRIPASSTTGVDRPPVASVLRGPRVLHVKHVCRDEQWKCGHAQRPREPARNMNETRDQQRPDDLAYGEGGRHCPDHSQSVTARDAT